VSGVSGSLKEAVEWLYSTQLFGVKLGLEGARRLAAAFGVSPFRGAALGEAGLGGGRGFSGRKFIHVAGTNGKGSTCAMLAAMCRQAGLRTGLYTSPHLVSVRERLQYDGDWISDAELLESLNRMRRLVEDWDPHPTFFEIVTVLALEWFERKGTDVVILETGLGGRLDATNIVTPAACAISSVGLDHQQYLGETLVDIAGEKAGIFKPSVPVVTSPQEAAVMGVFERRALEVGCALRTITAPWNGGPLGLKGEVQRWNAALAVAVLDAAGIEVDEMARRKGLAQVEWPGRFQEVLPGLVLDGAHNPAAAAVLVETWKETFGEVRASMIFGSMQDKDTAGVLRALEPIVGDFMFVPLQNPRAISVEALSALAREQMPGIPRRVLGSIAEALDTSVSGHKLVTGSLFLVGEVLAKIRGAEAEATAQ